MDMIELFDEIKGTSKEQLEKIILLSLIENNKVKYKLNKIEDMFKSGTVDLEELRKIVLEVE